MTKVLICLLFKDSALWINRFFECIDSLFVNKPISIEYGLSVVYGDSKDGTDDIVKSKIEEIRSKYRVQINLFNLSMPGRLDGLEKLATLRNSCIELSNVSGYDYVLMVDTDIIFGSYIIEKFLGIMERKKDIGIIAPMVMIDNFRTFANTYFYDAFAFRLGGKLFEHLPPYLPIEAIKKFRMIGVKDIKIDDLVNGKMVELDSVGSIYLCRSDIYWKYDIKYATQEREDWKEYNSKYSKLKVIPFSHRKYESEQVCWCNKVREKTGYKIIIDPTVKVYHVNLEPLGLDWH